MQTMYNNTYTNEFTVKDKYYRGLLPDPLFIHKSFTININNKDISYLIFAKITGHHFLHCMTMNQTYDFVYNSSDDWFKSIEYIESNRINYIAHVIIYLQKNNVTIFFLENK